MNGYRLRALRGQLRPGTVLRQIGGTALMLGEVTLTSFTLRSATGERRVVPRHVLEGDVLRGALELVKVSA